MLVNPKSLDRRTLLRGLGVCLSLPMLEAMIPAGRAAARGARAARTRFVAIEMVHGSAGSTAFGRQQNYWSPAESGESFAFTPTLKSLEPLRDYITIVSNTELRGAETQSPAEDGQMVDHARSSAAFLTGAHPLRSDKGDIAAGPSLDQLYAGLAGQNTRLPSLRLSVESNDDGLAWPPGYAAPYRQTLSWADAATPLPMVRDLGAAFAQLFCPDGGMPACRASILDPVRGDAKVLARSLGAQDRHRVDAYFEQIRDVERRIRAAGADGTEAPPGAPASFSEHVQILGDLQILAFMGDITRVSAVKLGMDRSQRVYPESGVDLPFHTASHHRNEPEKVAVFARLNAYHVQQVAGFLERLRDTMDGEDNLLQQSIVLYGSPMGDSHVHAHTFLPLFVAGHGSGTVRGNRHVACEAGTPMADLLLTLARRLGVETGRIGDSAGEIAI